MLPNIGQVINLQVAAQDEQEAMRTFKSRIADEVNEQLLIEAPIDDKGRMRKLFDGDMLSVSFFKHADGATYYFQSYVTGSQREDGMVFFSIRKPDKTEITRVQRRSFLRVDAGLEVAGRFAGERFLAVTKDISGGGLSMITKSSVTLHEKDTIECWLLIQYRNGELEHVPFKAEIVRTNRTDYGLLMMVQFKEIAEADRQKIVRFCFEKQLEQRK